ncbi:flagella cluster protein [Halonotius terrestris]|uniref:Flagella cluster protein n=1 Tax=Halonotius terrestris TaxID=2487750 RepID=A0A8J8TD38_9EURY|nr:flagella cluster protein [Halonotius terrestris]TQQ83028.1 flagella cluster protein [Halonotius terrestris]
MAEPFDIHDHRHQMKQLKESSDSGLYDNRDDVDCPVCADTFNRLFILRSHEQQFPENDGARFCLLNQDDGVYLFRH